MKADLIKQSQWAPPTSNEPPTSTSRPASRPGTGKRSATNDSQEPNSATTEHDEQSGTKKARPRSLTFTLSKGDQSTKKSKGSRNISHGRNKSADLTRSASSNSLNSVGSSSGSGFLGRCQKPAVPEDFISYLKKVQKPELVEVGRLQKLRQLLRNETVSWVDSFITKGGMAEIVALLYRTMDLEWRCVLTSFSCEYY